MFLLDTYPSILNKFNNNKNNNFTFYSLLSSCEQQRREIAYTQRRITPVLFFY